MAKRRNSKMEEPRNPECRGLNRRLHFIIKTPTSRCSETVAGRRTRTGGRRRTRRRRGRGRRRRRREKKEPELCRFVSEGEKSAARSNRPLIFLSCIKGSALWGGRAGEAALLMFAVYLAPRLRRRIHTYAAAAATASVPHHADTKPPYSGFLSQLSQELQRLVSLTRPSSLSETPKSDKRHSGTLPYSLLVLPPPPQPD